MPINLPVNPPNTPFIDLNTRRISREWYRYLSYLTSNTNSFTANTEAPYLLTSPVTGLPNSRVLSASSGISLSLSIGSAALSLTPSGVVAATYGSAAETISITVDQYGRITSAITFALNTDNITEGVTNLFFTQARARQSIIGGTGISYNNTTGVVALADTAVTPGSYGTSSSVGQFTVDQQGRLTAAANVAINAGALGGGQALTKVDDTNVTLTLGGTPSTALLTATSLTLGWAGTLSVARGGTGAGTFTANFMLKGNGTSAIASSTLVYDNGTNVGIGTSSPAGLLHVDNGIFYSQRYASSGAVLLRRANGTQGSPTQVNAASSISIIQSLGYDGTNYQPVAAISVSSDGAVSSSSSPGSISFQTTPSGAVVAVTRARVTSGGMVAIDYNFGRGAPVTKTADFTIADTENWLINNKSGSTCTATFPAASAWPGREIMITNYQAQTVVSASSNIVPITGGAAGTAILAATAGKWATLVSNGTNWVIMQTA